MDNISVEEGPDPFDDLYEEGETITDPPEESDPSADPAEGEASAPGTESQSRPESPAENKKPRKPVSGKKKNRNRRGFPVMGYVLIGCIALVLLVFVVAMISQDKAPSDVYAEGASQEQEEKRKAQQEERVTYVMQLIDGIPSLNELDSGDQNHIEYTSKEYAALTEEEQLLVENRQKLLDAIEKIPEVIQKEEQESIEEAEKKKKGKGK